MMKETIDKVEFIEFFSSITPSFINNVMAQVARAGVDSNFMACPVDSFCKIIRDEMILASKDRLIEIIKCIGIFRNYWSFTEGRAKEDGVNLQINFNNGKDKLIELESEVVKQFDS